MPRREWAPRNGRCAVCGVRGRVVHHHIVTRHHIEAEGGDVWDFRNALPLGVWCQCHASHHAASRRIPRELLPADAFAFATDLLGEDRAELYMDRFYA